MERKRLSIFGYGAAWLGWDVLGLAWRGEARRGLARLVQARHGLARHGKVRLGTPLILWGERHPGETGLGQARRG
jgi:hypothetical protein